MAALTSFTLWHQLLQAAEPYWETEFWLRPPLYLSPLVKETETVVPTEHRTALCLHLWCTQAALLSDLCCCKGKYNLLIHSTGKATEGIRKRKCVIEIQISAQHIFCHFAALREKSLSMLSHQTKTGQTICVPEGLHLLLVRDSCVEYYNTVILETRWGFFFS